MKKILLLIISFLLFSCNGQEKSSDWKTLETISSKDKTKYILSLKNEFQFFNDLVSNTKSYLDKFTFIDLDNDGDDDLIYIGESGAEPKCIRIFLNNKNTFVKVFDEFSNKPLLTFKDDQLVNLKVFQTHCCSEGWDKHIKYFSIKIISNEFKNNKIEDYYVFEANQEPSNYQKSYKVHSNTTVNVRYSPAIGIITKKEYKDELKMSENIIGNLKTGVTVNVLGEKKDEKDGRTWLYVEANKNLFENANFVIVGEEDNFNVRGWISKKNVETEIININNAVNNEISSKSIGNYQKEFTENWYGVYHTDLNENNKDWRESQSVSLTIKKDSIIYEVAGYQIFQKYKLKGKINKGNLKLEFDKAMENTESAVLKTTKDFGQISFDGKNYNWVCPYNDISFMDDKKQIYILKKI